MKFNIDIESNFKYQTKNRDVKFDIGTNEIRQDFKKKSTKIGLIVLG